MTLTPDEKENGEPEPDNPFGTYQFIPSRSYDPAIIEAIEVLGADIDYMIDV